MSSHLFLIAYDVTSPRRARRVHRLLRRRGAWMQLSVFLCRMAPAAGPRLFRELSELVDSEQDRMILADLGVADGARLLTLGAPQPPTKPRALIL